MSEGDQRGRSTRFKPGQSGNPKGRPRKAKAPKTESAFDVLQDRRITARIDGHDRELTVREALLHKTYQDALGGSPMAIRAILKMIIDQDAKLAPQRRLLPEICCEFPDPAGVDQALVILGIATQMAGPAKSDTARSLQLTSWAVNSSLQRKHAARLSDKDVLELKGHTEDPDAVHWPRGCDQ
jgi:hypothetical protein